VMLASRPWPALPVVQSTGFGDDVSCVIGSRTTQVMD